jgi:hypothetical protein
MDINCLIFLISELKVLLQLAVILTNMLMGQKDAVFYFSEKRDFVNTNSLFALTGMEVFTQQLVWLVQDQEM